MKVLKFGGSSIADATRIQRVIDIINTYKNKETSVVVSAFGGVTDELIAIVKMALMNVDYAKRVQELEQRHLKILTALISNKKELEQIAQTVKTLFSEMVNLLKGISLVKECSDKTLDYMMSFGERLSAMMISQTLLSQKTDCVFVDARQVIKTDNVFGAARGIGAKVDLEKTTTLIKNFYAKNKKLKIITGFIAESDKGHTTTLGRNGSDYTASIFAAAIDAKQLEIWKEVDGVLTADPRMVNQPFVLKSVSYEEAMELSHFGANVIHPSTMTPVMEKNIPIWIKNSFNKNAIGTVIKRDGGKDTQDVIKGVTAIPKIALLQLKGNGMMGIPGSSKRLFDALAQAQVNVILITQASSQHTLCVAINQANAVEAKRLVDEEFRLEIKSKEIDPITITNDLCIVAIVGEGMRSAVGTSGKMFSALGKNGVNIIAIAQGSSELNISAVVTEQDKYKAINVLHDAFFISQTTTLHLFLIGVGLIGKTLIQMIQKQLPTLQEKHLLDIKILGISRTQKMYFSEAGISTQKHESILEEKGEKANLAKFVKTMKDMNYSNSVLIDCTSNEEVISYYEEILQHNISIVTPNKKANSSTYKSYRTLKTTAQQRGVKFLYETNVGAGLPIISTINDLLNSGDTIVKIEAVLSGTLNYIFSHFSAQNKFSEVVLEAKQKGFTEPDPRDDLNGMDVARKIVILAREVGATLEMKDIDVQNLVPEDCRKIKDIEAFMLKLQTHNAHFETLRKKAEDKGEKLRFAAHFENNKAKVSLVSVPASHPFYNLNGSDNIISITSQRYLKQPLVIKGPGAGADVTAAGVFADIIRIGNYVK